MANPQTSDVSKPQPIWAVNAKWVNGVAPGYWPTAGYPLLTLNLSPGASFANGARTNYVGGTVSLPDNSTSYVYLDPAASNAPTSNTTGYPASVIRICTVVTASGAITTITDDRTWFNAPAPGGVNAQTGASYSIAAADNGKLVTFANSGAVAVTLPTSLGARFVCAIENLGAGSPLSGTVTLTPSSGLINGAANLVLAQGQGGWLFFDGTNWEAVTGGGGGGGGTPGGTNHEVQINSSGAFAGLATGTAGQYLRSGGASADPAFASIAESEVANLVSDLALKAPLASPALTGTPTAPTPTTGDDSTKIATTAFVEDTIDNLVPGDIPNIAESQVTNLTTDLAAAATKVGVQDESYTYAADTGTANAYAVTLSPTPTLVAGSKVIFKAAHANTAASTIAVNGGSPINIYKKTNSALAAGDILLNQIIELTYDGTNFQLLGDGATGASPLVIGFVINNGAVGNNVGPMLQPSRAGSISKCAIVTKSSDGVTGLTFRIKQNGVDIFTSDPTVAAGTSAGTTSSSSSLTTNPLPVAVSDVFQIDITSGSPNWAFTAQLET